MPSPYILPHEKEPTDSVFVKVCQCVASSDLVFGEYHLFKGKVGVVLPLLIKILSCLSAMSSHRREFLSGSLHNNEWIDNLYSNGNIL